LLNGRGYRGADFLGKLTHSWVRPVLDLMASDDKVKSYQMEEDFEPDNEVFRAEEAEFT
jgi:hypothetical protein